MEQKQENKDKHSGHWVYLNQKKDHSELHDIVHKVNKLYSTDEWRRSYRGVKSTTKGGGHTGRGQHLPGSGSSMWHVTGSELQSWQLRRGKGKQYSVHRSCYIRFFSHMSHPNSVSAKEAVIHSRAQILTGFCVCVIFGLSVCHFVRGNI